MADDKYPSETGRRRFVKGVAGSATLASVGAGGAAAIDATTAPSGAGGGITQYFGIENTDGPAPRGMPMVPIEINDAGELKGIWPEVSEKTEAGRTITVAEEELGGVNYSSTWYQYCGVQSYEGAQPDADQENFFRSSSGPPYSWQQEAKEAGEKLTVDDFSDYQEWGNGIGQAGIGKPAMATWRSQDVDNTMPVQILRSKRVEQMANAEGPFSDISGEVQTWLQAATDRGFMAWLNKCTHFCCVPGFKHLAGSATFGGENSVYCQCHQSIYDPFSVVRKQFVALPRPE
jgi:Rieske Fe-S protein